jgi:uncharacterized protein
VTLPIFPLSTVLFPQGLLPLQIFEVRYLNMVQRCHREHTPFVVACLHQGQEVQRPGDANGFAPEDFYPTGTLAYVTELDTVRAGLLWVVCRGGERVHIQRSEKGPLGLWVGDTSPLPEDRVVAIPSELSHVSDALLEVHTQLHRDHPNAMGATAPLAAQAPEWQNAGWVANRWAELLPLAADFKQRLLTLDSPLLRLELIDDQLDELGLGS